MNAFSREEPPHTDSVEATPAHKSLALCCSKVFGFCIGVSADCRAGLRKRADQLFKSHVQNLNRFARGPCLSVSRS
jgi:hypothetical protein